MVSYCFGVVITIGFGLLAAGQRPPCPGTGSTAFEQNCIVPDLIPVPPTEKLHVRYSDTVTVNGSEFDPSVVKDAPTFGAPSEHKGIRADSLYTLANLDPDATGTRAPIIHWLVVNVPGTNISQGNELMSYRGSRPPPGSGIHRYIFLLYLQPGRLDVSSPALKLNPDKRTNFEIKDFARIHNLGDPVAGNFYQAQYSDFLAAFHNQTTTTRPV